MRFMTRSLLGVALMALTLALVGAGIRTLAVAVADHNAGNERSSRNKERVYTVSVAPVELVNVRPRITSYGEIESGRSLEIRAVRGGALVELGGAFRDGAVVEAGSLLFATNPADAQSVRDLSETELLDAEGELLDARVDVELAGSELTAAERQLELRTTAVQRQEDLVRRKVGTAAALETAALSLSAAEQALVSRRQALARAEARLKRAEVGVKRRKIALNEAQRLLDDTRQTAPFRGVLSGVSAVEGRLVSPNETLGTLIDPTALEVAFRVSNAEFARLTRGGGALDDVRVDVTLALDGQDVNATGRLRRVGAEVGANQTGRLLFGQLDEVPAGTLLPGDFVTVTIVEPEMSDIAVLPSDAVNSSGRVLLLGAEDRLEAVAAEITRRQGDTVLMTGLPAGREYVTIQLPQLGPGIKVNPVREDAQMAAAEMVTLDPERQARLIAAIERNGFIPKDRKAQILKRLRSGTVPKEMIERMEARMGGGGGARVKAEGGDAAKIALEPQRRSKLRAFVEANERMPSEVKTRILRQLDEDEVDQALVDRLEARIGG